MAWLWVTDPTFSAIVSGLRYCLGVAVGGQVCERPVLPLPNSRWMLSGFSRYHHTEEGWVRTRLWVSWLVIPFVGLLPVEAQEAPRPEDVATIDGILSAYYEVVSGPAGEAVDAARDRSLHHPSAWVAIAGRTRVGGRSVNVMDLSGYHGENAPRAEGFFEWETDRVIQRSGNMVHVWSHYASARTPDGEPFDTGVNSITLFHDGDRWWIMGWMFDTEAPSPQDTFWASLQSLCDQAFAGTLEEVSPPDDSFEGQAMVMHVRECTDDVIRVPFFVGEDRSRTWVFSRTGDGLRLKHDHRHEDGTEDEVTQYGGDTEGPGTGTTQEFHADEHTVELIPAAATNVWTVTLEPGLLYSYALRREGTDRRFRVVFDLTRPIEAPPAPWGH